MNFIKTPINATAIKSPAISTHPVDLEGDQGIVCCGCTWNHACGIVRKGMSTGK